ncbi:MAG: hypothetical protein KAI53_03470 [Candidatus Aenigmarchaeota archaeon]|nr:hypothetical protein [Candidatus Aenigmarchaeota archaeon]
MITNFYENGFAGDCSLFGENPNTLPFVATKDIINPALVEGELYVESGLSDGVY